MNASMLRWGMGVMVLCLCLGVAMPVLAQQGEGTAVKPGKILFSTAPINAEKPEKAITTFKSGDYIYALVQVEKNWRDLLGKGNKSAKEVEVPMEMWVDGQKVDFQYITIKKAEALDGKALVLDIAPEPAKMTAYKDPGFAWAEGKGRRKIGPDTYTFNLAEMKPGKHTIKFQIFSFGDAFSVGEFTIEGDNYKFYGDLREKILKEAFAVAGMPKAQMTDKELETTMKKLLENRGWKNIRKLVIVDKDWWLDRTEGGDSPIKGRHIAAAAAAKGEDGKFHWATVTYEQQKTLSGWSTLEISDIGEKKPILEENIDM